MRSNEPLEQSELWELSRQLVSFNTVSALSNEQATTYLANYLEDLGFVVRLVHEVIDGVEKATVLAWIGPEVPGGLIISGHTDIVPFEGQPGWTVDPLRLSHDEQRIYGRGVSDMKVFIAQALLAAKATSLYALKRPLVFIFTCDEELAGQGSERLVKLLPELLPDYPLPDVALIGEPTNFAIWPAHKGYASFDILVHGKGGHSSAPHKGLNAIEKMAEVIREISSFNSELLAQATNENKILFPDYPSSVFNFGLIQGGLAPNMIAEACRLTASIRISPGDSTETLLTTLRKRIETTILPAMQAAAPEANVVVEQAITVPPMLSPTDNTFCQLLCQIMGQKAEIGAPYATDGGQFQLAGIRSYICGPGLLEEAHQPNESIPLPNFWRGQEKIEQLIQRWCF
ncbi:MAG TPA: acetylornithine deacetylase [Ktedonobacteraceae bacterium]